MGTKRVAIQTMKLTNESVKNQPLVASGKAYIYDTERRGFCLRVTPTSKFYAVRIKVGGKEYQRSICRVEDSTAVAARAKAEVMIGEFRQGIDQKAIKRAEAEAAKKAADDAEQLQANQVTLSTALADYLPTAISARTKRPLKERTKSDYRYLMDNELKLWNETPLASIDRDMAGSMMATISGARGSTRAVHAMRLVRLLCRKNKSGLLDWEGFGLTTRARKTGLRPTDGRILFEALGDMTHNLASSPYVMALLLTGCRRGELAKVLVSDVGHGGRTITLRDTKNGSDFVIQCSTQLREIVCKLIVDKDGDPRPADAALFGLCGDPRRTLENCNRIVQAAADEASAINGTAMLDKSFSLHSLRKLCSITLTHLKYPESVVDAVLNHAPDSSNVTRHNYIGEIDPEDMRLAWQALADYYAATQTNVIQLPVIKAAA